MRVFLKVREEGGGRDAEVGLETTAYKSPEAGCRCQCQFQKIFNSPSALYVSDFDSGLHLVEGGGVWRDAENTSTPVIPKWRRHGSSAKSIVVLDAVLPLP